MIIIALIIIVIGMCCLPASAQNDNYTVPNNQLPYGSIQPFQGLTPNPGVDARAEYNPQQSYPSAGNAQFYQNPNFPLQGSMRLNRADLPDNAPNQQNPSAYMPPNSQPADGLISPPQNNFNGSMPAGMRSGYSPPYVSSGPLFGPNPFPPPSSIPVALRNQASELINKAYALSEAGNNEGAIEILKQAEKLDPSSDVAHLDLSAAYIALKDYDEALQETTIVLQMNPTDEKNYLNYLAAAIGANHMQDALRVGNEYLKRFPDGENRISLNNEMVAVEHELDTRAKTRGIMTPPGSPDNYLFYVTPYGKRRWPANRMPLKVYINSGAGYKGFAPEFQSALINSFMSWQTATRGVLRFVPVDNPRLADIECQWTDSTANVSLAAEAGEAKVESLGTNIFHVTITLLTCRPDMPSEKIGVNLLQQVTLHEIGHALGIDGHSDRAQDIMFCSTNQNVEKPQLTQRDVNTLYLLYQE